MLTKSMLRLKIPSDFIQITQNILTNHSCQVIIPHRPTDSISILDGIPQGETISPLWWTIFYDPLLNKLSNQKNKPYNLTNNLTFMDNLNLISKNHKEIQKLLNITFQFFSINNISIHPKKTKLITINPNKNNTTNTITLNNYNSSLIQPHIQSTITSLPNNESIRILGIYLSKNSILKPGREKIKENIITITHSLKTKYTTGPIASYIYNKVLFPRIEYHLQTTFLTPNQLLTYQRIINSTLKHKFSIEQTLSNKWFYNPIIFHIKPIFDLQQEVLISNLQYKLSDPTIKPYINLELLSLQKTNCIPTCILQNPSPIFTLSTNSHSLKLTKTHNISFCHPNLCSHQISIPKSKTPLYTLFTTIQLKKYTPQLYKKNFLYLEQLTSYEKDVLIKWHHLPHLTNNIQRGKIPNWYKTLQSINPLISDNPLFTPNPKRKFIALQTNDDLHIGKKQRIINNFLTLINHYQQINDDPNNSITIYPCTGCPINTINSSNKCKFPINNHQSFNLYTKKTYNKITTRIFKHNLSIHLYNQFSNNSYNQQSFSQPLSNHPTITVPLISDFLTNQNISHNPLINLINQINHNSSTDIKYLIKIKISKNTIPNIITINSLIINIDFSFILTSNYSLLLTIYNLITFLLLITPSHSFFTIISNHSPLYNINKHFSPNSRNNCKTLFLASIINIHNIIKTKSSSFSVKKLTSNLKKTLISNHNPIDLTINPINSSIINAYDTNNNNTPLPSLRNYLKKSNKLFNTINSINFTKTSLLYHHNPPAYTSQILLLQNSPKPKNNSKSNLFNFHLKIITNTLPTKQYLNQKYLSLYTNNLCPLCKLFTENLTHILTCPNLTTSTSSFIQET